MARFWDPQKGAVLLGGSPLPDIGADALPSQASIVFQDVCLFQDAVAERQQAGAWRLARE